MSRSFSSLVKIRPTFPIEMHQWKTCQIWVLPAVNIPAKSQYINCDRGLLNYVGGETMGGVITLSRIDVLIWCKKCSIVNIKLSNNQNLFVCCPWNTFLVFPSSFKTRNDKLHFLKMPYWNTWTKFLLSPKQMKRGKMKAPYAWILLSLTSSGVRLIQHEQARTSNSWILMSATSSGVFLICNSPIYQAEQSQKWISRLSVS